MKHDFRPESEMSLRCSPCLCMILFVSAAPQDTLPEHRSNYSALKSETTSIRNETVTKNTTETILLLSI